MQLLYHPSLLLLSSPRVYTPPSPPTEKAVHNPLNTAASFPSLPLFSLKSNGLDRLISCD